MSLMCLFLHSLSPYSAPLPHCFPTLGWIIQGFPVCPRSPYPIQKWLFSRQPHRAVHEEGNISEGSSFPTAFLPFLSDQLSIFSFLDTCPHDFAAPASLSLVSPTSLSTYFGFFLSTLGFVLPDSSMQMDPPTSPATLTMSSLPLASPQQHEDHRHDYCFRGC